MIHKGRVTARMEGDFVVFLIGMRVNRIVKVRRWLPVIRSMQRMLVELANQPELGLMHHEMWLGRTTLMVQYWRSMDQLHAYAKNKDAEHLPAWKAFNQSIGTDGSVGIWHETYAAAPGTYESIYTHMPPFGLGKAGALLAASGTRESAAGRLLDRNASH